VKVTLEDLNGGGKMGTGYAPVRGPHRNRNGYRSS